MIEYRLCALSTRGGHVFHWPKRDLTHAEKALDDFLRNGRRGLFSGATVWIESREVSEWAQVGDKQLKETEGRKER